MGIMVQEKLKILKGLFFFNFKPAHRNAFNEVENENPLNKNENKIVGNGVYLAVDINEAKEYAKPINYKSNQLRVVFMCRINPKKTKICNDGRYYVLGGEDILNEVRPYRVLFYFEKNK